MIGLDTGLISGWLPAITDNGDGTVGLTFSFGVNEKIAFNRPAPLAPFDAEISLELNVVDLDGAYYGDGAGADLNPAKFGDTGAGQGMAFDTDKEQRWGRLAIGNAFGSELLPVSVLLQADYFVDSTLGFIPNVDDVCTTYQASNASIVDVNLADGLEASEAAVLAPMVPTLLVNGREDPAAPLVISDESDASQGPGEGNTGSLQILLDLSALTGAAQDWLQFDWENLDGMNDGPYTDNPAGRASFGIYKGSQDIIYIREPWN
jgi:MSHA biogenesis protein MshQ